MSIWLIVAWALWTVLYAIFVLGTVKAGWHWQRGFATETTTLMKIALIAGYLATFVGGLAVIYGG